MKKHLLSLSTAVFASLTLLAQVQTPLSNDALNGEEQNGTSATTTRHALFETFTSSTCPPCNSANANMEIIFNNNIGDHVSVKYQVDFPGSGDPYFTGDANVRRGYYNINSVPTVMIDGGWKGNGNSLTQAIYDQYKNVPSVVDLSAVYSVNGQTVCVDVDINPLADVNETNIKLFVAVKEKRTVNNVKTNGETEFFDVMKILLPDWTGKTINPMVTGQTQSYSFCWTFKGNYRLPNNASDRINNATEHSVEDFNDIVVAVWLQKKNTKEVYQAANATKVLGVDDFDPISHNLKIYPNPTTDFTTVSIDMVKRSEADIAIINALGQTVKTMSSTLISGTNQVELDVQGLGAGLYFVRIEIEGKAQVLKLNVQ